MALEGIRVVGPTGGRERRGRKKRDGEKKKRFGDALKQKLDDSGTAPEAEAGSEEAGGKKSTRRRSSRWWGSEKRIDFVV